VQIAERWLLARIRNETFTSLGALNARLMELTTDLKGRTMPTYKASRRELFERSTSPSSSRRPARSRRRRWQDGGSAPHQGAAGGDDVSARP